MRWTVPLVILSVSLATAQEPPDTNYDESKVPRYELPDPLVCFDGQKVTDAETWRDVRRPEILRAFATHMYGRTPAIKMQLRFETTSTEPRALEGLATRKEIRIRLFEAGDAPRIDLLLYVPNKTPGPAPVFLGLNYGNQGVNADPDITPSRNAVCRRGEHAHRWPLELLLKRGYAVASFHGGDIELDRHGSGCRFTTEGWQKGVRHHVLQQEGRTDLADDEWGSIGVWAWGLSRALDYLQTDPDIDSKKVAVFGHSRTGKTALWAGAQDERFALVISNNSGQGGASLARRRYGESVAASYSLSGIWYCRNYRQYGNNEPALPVDAHMLIAAIAPRPVYVASAEQDRWADPRGEFLAARHADPVYRLLGIPGLGVAKMPAVNRPVGQSIGYHVRSGDHEITPYDWQRYLDFADRHSRVRRDIDGMPSSSNLKASAATVSRNDVLYVTPSIEPWEAMPVGGGDLSAMVRSDGAGLDLHLTKSDAWGFQAPPDAPPGTRFFNNVSPGHVRLEFGERAWAAAAQQFRQRLDLYHGRIVLQFGRESDSPRLEIWGHPQRKLLVVEVTDPRRVLDPAKIQLCQWRPSMKLSATGTTIHAAEVHERAAGPHLANTGMEGHFDASKDPLLGRGTAVVLAVGDLRPKECSSEGKQATMILPQQRPSRYYVVIAAAVTTDGDPLAAARREKDAALAVPLATLKAEQQAWWRSYWNKSLLRIHSPDKMADRLCAAYHVHLYTLACVNRGPVPCKWDGGAGLMRGDERTWGLSEWVQEIRFTYLPLYAANRLEMARGLTRHYSQMRPYLREQTERMWGVKGLWIPETVLPWGHAEDFILDDSGKPRAGHFLPWEPKTARYGNFQRFNGYVGFLFTSGLELCHHYLTYYRYSGDEHFLHEEAYPMLRDVCRFVSGLMRKEADGCWHLDPANALETWWMVRDPADTLAGIQAVFPEFIRLSKVLGQDGQLRAKCQEILAALPAPSVAHWGRDGTIDAGAKTYAPAAAKGDFPTPRNFEIPELYRVFPFGLSGIGTPDYDLARHTFDRRIFGITNSWSLDAVWAARLGLGQEACKLLAEHAVRYNRFRYGGWDSSNSSVFPAGLSVVPYTDGAGLSAYGLHEALLQSHNDLIRVLPAVSKDWSGIFRLRAEGGFLVAADFAEGDARLVEIQSLFGRRCRIQNPWGQTCVVRTADREVYRGDDHELGFGTQAGQTYLLTPPGRLLSDIKVAPIKP